MDQKQSTSGNIAGLNAASPYARTVAGLFRIGRDNVAETSAYHGTSIIAVKHLIRTGLLLPSTERHCHTEGHLYFAPLKEKCAGFEWARGVQTFGWGFEEAKGYAETAARRHHVMAALGLSFSSREDSKAASSLFNEGREQAAALRYFESRGHPAALVQALADDAEEYQGVVIALHDKCLSDFRVSNSDLGDCRIAAPDGLAIAYLTGIEPCGQKEYDFLDGL